VLASLFAEQERTILIIAHRASALGLCDRVMELKDGRIVSD
jgi:ABC-type multidrug transport system fused ATPase/permease subunit